MTARVIAGTGSRSLRLAAWGDRLAVYRAVSETIGEYPEDAVVVSGMAEGFDETVAHAALDLGRRLWCAVPNRGYGRHYWGENSLTGTDRIDRFASVLERAERVVYVLEEVHGGRGIKHLGVHANFLRNTWMVEQVKAGDGVVLAWRPTSTGTAHCVGECARLGVPVREIGAPE